MKPLKSEMFSSKCKYNRVRGVWLIVTTGVTLVGDREITTILKVIIISPGIETIITLSIMLTISRYYIEVDCRNNVHIK